MSLNRIAYQVGDNPKLDQWNPELCGDMDIVIDANGCWHNQGTPFSRESLVRLFASILRRETDGEHYLVTPVEKWRIQVADAPFLLTELIEDEDGHWLTGPYGVRCPVNSEHLWQLRAGVPYVALWHGCWGKISRALFYQLAERAEQRDGQYGLQLGDTWCVLGEAE